MKRLALGVMVLCAASVAVFADDRHAGEDEPPRWLKLEKGTRVRLMVEDGSPMREVVGRLLASDATTVTVDAAGGPQRLSRDRLFHLQYLAGGRDHKKGAVIGAAISGAAGFIAGVVIGVREVGKETDADGRCDQCGIAVGLIGVAGGLTAAIPGGAIGFAIGAPGSDWRGAKADGLTVAGGASPRGATVALRLRLGHRTGRLVL